MNLYWQLLVSAFTLIVSLAIHELAHRKWVRLYGKTPVTTWEKGAFVTSYDGTGLHHQAHETILLAGIFLGFTPFLFLAVSGVLHPIIQLGVWLLYALACKYDLKKLHKIEKEHHHSGGMTL